jgi:hypothetical protein
MHDADHGATRCRHPGCFLDILAHGRESGGDMVRELLGCVLEEDEHHV